MRFALVTLLLVVALAAAGCGGNGKPFAIRNGMTMAQVRAAAGDPGRVVSCRSGPCWWYRGPKNYSGPIEVFFKDGRVVAIDWSASI
jgi:hypothetical protein